MRPSLNSSMVASPRGADSPSEAGRDWCARASSSAGASRVRSSVARMPSIASRTRGRLAVKGVRTSAPWANDTTMISGAATANKPPPCSDSARAMAACRACSRRETPPSPSSVRMLAEQSTSRITRPPPEPSPRSTGWAAASASSASSAACSSSNGVARSLWKGALARRSSVRRVHGSVLLTTRRVRRSRRKYSASSGTSVAASSVAPSAGLSTLIAAALRAAGSRA